MASLRLAFRKLAHQPLFALLSIGTLGIGIGAVSTCFSAVNTLLFRPPPAAANSERAVVLDQTRLTETDERGNPVRIGFRATDADYIAAHTKTLSGLWLFTNLTTIVEGENEPLRYLGTRISAAAFDLLGVTPHLGRNFTALDTVADAEPVALLSYAAWQKRFHGDPDAINTRLEINGRPTTIVGIMPPRWRYPDYSDVWLPLPTGQPAGQDEMLDSFYFSAQGVLAPGVTVRQARAELTGFARSLAIDHAKTNADLGVLVEHWRDEPKRDSLYFTLLLFGAGIAIFLIACANVANLQLSRGSIRGPEIAVRVALGANRGQIFRQLLIENIVLGLLGSGLGAIVGLWGVDLAMTSMQIEQPFWFVLDPDWRVILFTAGCGLLASLVFGLAPSWRDSQTDVIAGIKEGSRTGTDQGAYGMRLRNGIVIAELALAMVLLIGAGLMTRSFLALRSIDPGYNPANVLTFRVGFPVGYESGPNEIESFFTQLPAQLRRLPNVTHAAAISSLPSGKVSLSPATLLPIAGPTHGPSILPRATYRIATPDYFPTMEIPLLVGRDFATSDGTAPHAVAIVDTIFAATVGLEPGELLGRRVAVASDGKYRDRPDNFAEIVGVVGSIQHQHNKLDLLPTIYLSADQAPQNFMSVVLRTTVPPTDLANYVGHEVLAVNSRMPIYDVLSLEQVILHSIWEQYFFSRQFLCAGVIAMLLACVGIYGVMTFSVTMRRHEIGLRMALGAPASEVMRDVVKSGSKLVALGLGSGLIAALILANLLNGFLHGVSPHDPPTFALVPILLAAVALLACYLSSRRATRIDPMTAMRTE